MKVIKTLAELKRTMKVGQRYEVLEHYFHPQYKGQIREVVESRPTIFFSKEPDNADSIINRYNDGKGIRTEFGNAKHWKFNDDGTIIYYNIWTPYYSAKERKDVVMVIKLRD